MWIHYLLLASASQLVYALGSARAPIAVLGGFFEENAFMRRSFLLAVNTVNECTRDYEICELIHNTGDDVDLNRYHKVQIIAKAAEVDDDLIYIYKKFGQMAGANGSLSGDEGLGLSSVIGPHERTASVYTQGLCALHDIPHIVIRRESRPTPGPVKPINLYPDTNALAAVYAQMIKRMKWESFSILYEDTDGLIALQDVLKIYPMVPPYTHDIRAFKLGSGPNFSEPLLTAKYSGHKNFLLDCDYDILFDVMRQAQEVGLMSEAYKYIITSLNFQATNLWAFQHTGANISGLRLVDPDDPFVSSFVGTHLYDFGIESVDKLRVEDALMFDAVALFAQGYKDLAYANPNGRRGAKLPKDYSQARPWPEGLSLRNYILSSKLNGLTGPLMFDADGLRRNFKLDVLNLHHTGLAKVGTWHPDRGFDELNLVNEVALEHFKVLITMNAPYAQKVNRSGSLTGNDRYEGFVIDIIKAIAKELNFNYTFYVQADSDNGSCKKDNSTKQCSCTGMMGKILRDEMDMAITDLTITENRAQCIQFSTTFMNLGMSILYKKPQKAKPKWYSFFMPFNRSVWMYLALVWITVSLLFYIFGRLSPPEWTNPYPCIDEPTELENQFQIDNAIWFTIGTLLQQGTEHAPIGMSTRCLAGWWWFFCLIITNTYTANLAAFLTIEKPEVIVRDIRDLYDQTTIKYGAKKGGATFKYFESATDPQTNAMYQNMIDPEWWKKWMVDTNDQGIALVAGEENNYAFFTESPTIEYVQHRICNLEQAGGLIDQKAYAIGFATNFKYALEVNEVMSKLNENSVVKNLYKKWWTEKGAVCTDSSSNLPTPMTLTQLVGVFYVLGGGFLVSFAVLSLEFALNVYSVSKSKKIAFKETFSKEVEFIKGMKSIKPVLRRKSSADNYSGDLMMTSQT
ncbi:glutamate receptor ionotropic, kainate 3-like [Phymastichus coffea]|uniref:glutamate receptor ionotropic, kainate 3-like n=1 Tax=Phymastichus coffea TaxID=108790 RepID=UPI00273C109D|nr:glutamate receptor ionotropic, kainate 3-like [Phymastichus coffea]XP_058806174.1 glutamate receptor ionotropic, kainate 3-like [Phymastichus coffea]